MVKETISEAIGDLEKASNGEEVRQALIDLIDTMNTIGGDTELLAMHNQQYYVLEKEFKAFEDEINMWLQFDKVPTRKSLNLMKNKDQTAYFVDILKKLKKLNGDTKGNYDEAPPSEIGNDIQEALNAAHNTFEAIESAIGRQGVTVPDTDSVLDYGKRISQINKTTVDVQPYIVTVNGTEVEETRDPETREITKAYTPVTVQLELNGWSDTIRANGRYTVPEGYDGWENVIVDIDNSGSKTSGGGSSGGGGSSSGGSKKKGAISDDVTYNLSGADIRENTTVKASDYGVDAFDSATVAVTDYEFEDKTFKVTFTSEGEQLGEPVEVKMGDSAYYIGETPVYSKDDEFYYFSGWEPNPNCVVTDMTCEAQFNIWNPNGGSPISTNYRYLNSTWDEIISGSLGELGDIKILKLTDGRIFRMRKISKSGEGANSVWMSMEALRCDWFYDYTHYQSLDTISWADSQNAARNYLKGEFLSLIPENVRSHIVQMDKECLVAHAGLNSWTFTWENSKETIWPLGMVELNYLGASDTGDREISNYHNGILTPVTTNSYTGSSYKSYFQWFNSATPLKNQLKSYYNSYNGTNTPSPLVMVRQMYPHVKKEFTIPEHTKDGQVIPAHTYTDWDALDITTKCDFNNVAPRFDDYTIEHKELGSKYNPFLNFGVVQFNGITMLDYRALTNQNKGCYLRDAFPMDTRYGDIPLNKRPVFAAVDDYGIPSNRISHWSWESNVDVHFCFGLK